MLFDMMEYDLDDSGRIVDSRVVEEKIIPCDDVVLAIGNPFAVGQTVTMGIVSATGRMYGKVLQTDAAVTCASVWMVVACCRFLRRPSWAVAGAAVGA